MYRGGRKEERKLPFRHASTGKIKKKREPLLGDLAISFKTRRGKEKLSSASKRGGRVAGEPAKDRGGL